jgi:hypothetical protein
MPAASEWTASGAWPGDSDISPPTACLCRRFCHVRGTLCSRTRRAMPYLLLILPIALLALLVSCAI